MKIDNINELKEKYPKGTRIELIYMNDPYGLPSHSKGTVDFVDDAGQIQMNWDDGSSLALIYGEDKFKVIEKENSKESEYDL